jgi:hypothetical protein
MRRARLRLAAAAGLAALGAAVVPWQAPAASAATETVDDASFTWAISGYAQRGVFGPWQLSDATRDARVVRTSATDLDLQPVPATSLAAGTSQVGAVRFTGGDGTVDREDGSVSLAWDGSYTVNAYPASYEAPSETYADPRLEVDADGSGRLTMTLALGAGKDVDGNPSPPTSLGRVTLLTFSAGARTGLDAEGFRLDPDYRGVAVTLPSSATPQTRSCSGGTGWWGAWSQDLLDALGSTSIAAHFYSTGCGGMQDNKPPLPVDVTFGAPGDVPEPTPTPGPTPTAPAPTTDPDEDEVDAGWTVTDAQLRWGLNDESNNRSHAPGRYNFLSAGRLPDPGRGGSTVTASQWRQRAGDVRIEKYVAGSGYRPATWAGLRTGADGTEDVSPSDDVFTGHQVVLDGGAGTIDPDTDDGTIRWTGSFTVVFYSGYTFFHVSDPALVVRDGRARVTARLSGYGSSLADQSVWREVPARTVTLADLGRIDLRRQGGGFTVTPRYDRVAVDVPAGLAPQTRTGAHWGAFPQSFVDFQAEAGTAPFWYSSGGSTDAAKKALPLTVSYDADAPVRPPVPTPSADDAGDTPAAGTTAPAAPAPVAAAAAPGTATPAPLRAGGPVEPVLAAPAPRAASHAASTGVLGGDRGWWAGGGLLLAAGLVAAPVPWRLPGRRP